MDIEEIYKKNSLNLPKKIQFRFKRNENGLFLTIHNTIEENRNEIRIRFILATFSDNNTHLVAIDHRGSICAFDFTSKKYWKMFDQIPNCTDICNIPEDYSKFIISTKTGKIHLLDINLGIVQNSKKISLHCINGISIITKSSSSLRKQFLVYSTHEALICDLKSFEANYHLEFNENRFLLKYVSFIPNYDKILICFTNDIIHISSSNNFKTIRILHPIKIRDRYLNKNKNTNNKQLVSELCIPSNSESNLDMILNDPTQGCISSIKISLDGRLICLTFIDEYIMVLTVGDYEVSKIIKLKDIICKEIYFISSMEVLMFALTTTSDVLLIDSNNSKIKVIVKDGISYKFGISKDGQMFFTILTTGEINIYKTSIMLNLFKSIEKCYDPANIKKQNNTCKQIIDDETFIHELQENLTKDRLFPILKEYGEYPEKYRHLIWFTLLDLPENKKVFLELVKKGMHSAVECYDEKFPIKDHVSLRHLKKIVSCLLYWCKALTYCDYLPEFVFPFLNIFSNNILLTFELVVTLIINHCQLWFEFVPIEPLNYIGIIENILNEFDKELFEFYAKNEITGKIYAWQLMKTAFSEVLDNKQWYQLWDNIITNETYFLIFCIVSYNITQKKIIMNISNQNEIEDYFHQQNYINMKKFLSRAYSLMDKCPQIIHPKRYIKVYEKLPKGYYPKLENYPKDWIETKNNEMEMIQIEKENISKKIRELEIEEEKVLKHLEDKLKAEEQEKRKKELEKVYEDALLCEQEKMLCQRQVLLLYQKQIRERRAQVLELMAESENRRGVNEYENKLDTLQILSRKAEARNQIDMMFADDELKNQEFRVLEEKYKAKMNSVYRDDHFKDSIKCLKNEYHKLENEFKNLTENQYENLISNSNQTHDDKNEIDNIEKIIEHIQSEYLNVIQNEHETNKVNKLRKMETKTNELRQQLENMLYNIRKSKNNKK